MAGEKWRERCGGEEGLTGLGAWDCMGEGRNPGDRKGVLVGWFVGSSKYFSVFFIFSIFTFFLS